MVTLTGYGYKPSLLFLRVSQNSKFLTTLFLKNLDHPTIITMFHSVDCSLFRSFSDAGSSRLSTYLSKKYEYSTSFAGPF